VAAAVVLVVFLFLFRPKGVSQLASGPVSQ